MKIKLILFLTILLGYSGIAQQNGTVTGTVVDPQNIPLPGAEVKVVGKDIFDITDFDGNFSLEGVEDGDVLRITYLGFSPQEIPVSGATNYNVILEESASELDEVLLVGYGTQRKQDLTGAISRISSEEIVSQPSSTATQALQGKVAGVNITNSDAPGSTPTVTIRGLGTALGGRDPLYVVDGVPVTDISNISPSNIESIDFLKDASSAAIYGVRAANGVIIVTTKQGKQGKANFGIRSYSGIKPILNKVDMANADQYVTYFNEANAALPGGGGDQLLLGQRYDTDWYDELTQTGFVNNIVFDVSGGNETVNYFFSFDHHEEEGVLEDQKYRRSTITTNNTFNLFNDRLRIIENLNVSIRNDRPKPFSSFDAAYRQSPLVPVYYENGRFGGPYYNRATGEATYIAGPGENIGNLNSHGNPVASVLLNNQKQSSVTIQGSVTAELDITDHLKVSSRFGARKYFGRNRNFGNTLERWLASDPTRTIEDFEALKAQHPTNTSYAYNSLSFSSSESFKYNWDNFLNYNRHFGLHSFDLTLGGSQEQVGIGMSDNYQAYEVPNAEQYWSVNHASDQYEKQINQNYYTPTNYLSYFGRIQYNFASKYYFTGTIRRDGSSTFKNNANYWGTFPAFGVGWTLSEENFLAESNTINFLKLRASWGELGNANVPLNTTQILTTPNSGSQNYVFGPGQNLIQGAYIGSPAQNLGWEIVEEISVGLDYELFDYRLTGSIDYYNRNTENTILQVEPLLSSTFSTNFFDHGAEVVNEGFEFSANWSQEVNSDFRYNVGVNYSYNHNEVTNVRTNYEGQQGGSLNNGHITKRLAQGQPLGSWWMYEAQGVWQSEDEIANNAALGGARPGHLRYKDQNNDGLIDERDKVFQGSYIPTYNYGINIGVMYKNFDFSIDGYGVGGNKIYNGLLNARIGGENIPEETFTNRWTGPGSTNAHPGADRDIQASNYYLEDGDFFRINNITLGYTLPEFSQHVEGVRIYFSAQNPLIFTKYSGFTPELNSNGNPYGTTGIELAAYPTTSTYLVGLQIDL